MDTPISTEHHRIALGHRNRSRNNMRASLQFGNVPWPRLDVRVALTLPSQRSRPPGRRCRGRRGQAVHTRPCASERSPGSGRRGKGLKEQKPGIQRPHWPRAPPQGPACHGARPGRSLTEKKKCSGTSFPKKARGHSMCSTMVGGGWRLAVGGSWRLAVGNWRLVAVGGGWRRLVVGDWWLVAVGSGWQLVVGRRWRLAAVGGWRLVGVGGWRLVVPWGGP